MKGDIEVTDPIIVGVISAAAAIMGSSVGLISQIAEHSHDRKARMIERRINAYLDFIDSMQLFMNRSSSENFTKFQRAANVIMIIAANPVSTEVNAYYMHLVESSNNQNPLNEKEHSQYQNRIINLMRKDVGAASIDLENVRLVAFRG